MYPYVLVCYSYVLVCYSYVLVWCFSHDHIFICRMIKTTKRQDQMHLPSRSNSLILIPKAGNRVLIQSDPIRVQNNFIRSEMILLDPKSEKTRSDRIRFGFGLLSDRICTSLVLTLLRANLSLILTNTVLLRQTNNYDEQTVREQLTSVCLHRKCTSGRQEEYE